MCERPHKRNGKVTAVIHIAVSLDGKTMKFAITDKLHNTTANWMAEKQ